MQSHSYSCDVLVCGGGPGGICAAVSAARNGADTMLVERYGFLGGMATAGLVFPFMTRFAGGEQIIDGVFQEIIERLDAKGGYGGPDRPYMFDAEALKLVADEICLESGVRLLFHSYVDAAEVVDGRIARVIIHNKSGEQSISASFYVDGTGDADLAYLSGVPCEKGRASDGLTQPMTLNFRMAGVDTSRTPDRNEVTRLYLEARAQGRIDCPRNDVLQFSAFRPSEIHLNTTRIIRADGTNAEDLTRAEIDARRQMQEIAAWLVSDVPGFENAYIQVSGVQIGIRESRRVVGEYMLTAEDLLSARKFEDCIARGSYPVDIHDPDGGDTVIKRLAPGESYDIPYRSLVPKGIDNLLIAGRPISSTHEAHSAIRVMPIAAAIGEAAGAAAALCVRDKTTPRALDAVELRRVLLAQGRTWALSEATAMGLYICIGVLVVVPWVWPYVEPRLRPAHVADLKAGRKCIRCGEPISEGNTTIAAYGHKFGLAHLACEKDGLERAGYNSCLSIGLFFLLLLMFATGDLQEIGQGKMRWTDAGTGMMALALIVAGLRERFDTARWRRRVDRFLAEHPQIESEIKQ